MEYEIKCPDCGNKLLIQIKDDGEISVISFIENIDSNELQELLELNAIEFGVHKGGETSE